MSDTQLEVTVNVVVTAPTTTTAAATSHQFMDLPNDIHNLIVTFCPLDLLQVLLITNKTFFHSLIFTSKSVSQNILKFATDTLQSYSETLSENRYSYRRLQEVSAIIAIPLMCSAIALMWQQMKQNLIHHNHHHHHNQLDQYHQDQQHHQFHHSNTENKNMNKPIFQSLTGHSICEKMGKSVRARNATHTHTHSTHAKKKMQQKIAYRNSVNRMSIGSHSIKKIDDSNAEITVF